MSCRRATVEGLRGRLAMGSMLFDRSYPILVRDVEVGQEDDGYMLVERSRSASVCGRSMGTGHGAGAGLGGDWGESRVHAGTLGNDRRYVVRLQGLGQSEERSDGIGVAVPVAGLAGGGAPSVRSRPVRGSGSLPLVARIFSDGPRTLGSCGCPRPRRNPAGFGPR